LHFLFDRQGVLLHDERRRRSRRIFQWSRFEPSRRRYLKLGAEALKKKIPPAASCSRLVDLSNFRALDSHPTHESLLAEDERIDVVLERRSRERLGHAFFDPNKARTDAKFPARAPVEIVDRGVRHQKQHISERLNAGLKTIGSCDGVVVTDRRVLLK